MKKVTIVAEIGINHEGKINKCLTLIKKAANAGADVVKLQTIDPEKNYVKNSKSYKIFSKGNLTKTETEKAFKYAKKIGINIFTTCGDIDTANWVKRLNPWAWKISSGLLNHTPLISYLSKFKKTMIISTGVADLFDITKAIKTIRSNGNNKIITLQCTSNYPTKNENINLNKIKLYKEKFKCDVGFSDHSIGDDAAFLSVAAGSTLLEKHFTLDKSRKGFDHKISLEPIEFKKMVDKIRLAEKMMGLKSFRLTKNIKKIRKELIRTIVAKRDIKKGETLSINNLAIKRSSNNKNGFSPFMIKKLLGKVALKFIVKDSTVLYSYFK